MLSFIYKVTMSDRSELLVIPVRLAVYPFALWQRLTNQGRSHIRLLSDVETTSLSHKKPGQNGGGNKEDQQPGRLRKDRLHIAVTDKDA